MHIVRHGDRWAVADDPQATPHFESYTREEAEAEARRRAGGGEVHWHGEAEGRSGVGQGATDTGQGVEAQDAQKRGDHGGPGDLNRAPQAGL